MSKLPQYPDLPPSFPQEKHLSLQEVQQLLDARSYEWCRRVFKKVEGVLVVPADREPGDERRAKDDVLVPESVFERWYREHQVKSDGGAR